MLAALRADRGRRRDRSQETLARFLSGVLHLAPVTCAFPVCRKTVLSPLESICQKQGCQIIAAPQKRERRGELPLNRTKVAKLLAKAPLPW